jgi:hypothetical protein
MTDYHWTPANQRAFAECLSETGSITQACASVSMSRRAAYNLRNRASGFGFRIAWDAAVILSRCVIADQLMDRALSGQWTETVKDPDTGVTRRLGFDRPLGLALLSRLDKMFEFLADDQSQHMAAQIASQDFDVFLDLIEAEADASAIRDFIETRHDVWRMGRDLRYDAGFDHAPRPVEVKAAPPICAAPEPAPIPAIACELAQNSAALPAALSPIPRAETGFRTFQPMPSTSPRPGETGYHNWIKGQPWARL